MARKRPVAPKITAACGDMPLFIASFIPPVARVVLDVRTETTWMGYFYYVNTIGNPVIYYAFNDKFRDKVKETLKAFDLPCWL